VWALLVYLAVEGRRPQRRERLAVLLWPDHAPAQARMNLRRALASLRSALDDRRGAQAQLLLATRGTLALDPGAVIELDLLRFEQLLDACKRHCPPGTVLCPACVERLEQAVALYQGDFLEQLDLPRSSHYDEWAGLIRSRLQHLAVVAIGALGQHLERDGELERARALALRQLGLDPWDESAHRSLIRIALREGQRGAALAQFKQLRGSLAAELGAEPEPATQALFAQLFQGRQNGAAPTVGTAPSPEQTATALGGAVQSNAPLPRFPAQLIGRATEVATLAALFHEGAARLVTLSGPGGVGKTRVAVAAAERLRAHYVDGVAFVGLANLHDPRLVLAMIAQTLGVGEAAGVGLEDRLLAWLRPRRLLLVLDNLEHLSSAAPDLNRLLAEAPGLALLTTSRVRLRLYGEHELALPPLPVPEPGRLLEIEALRINPAVCLFTARARALRADFNVTFENAASVAEICRRLDGLPLAIELAAGWVKLLAPQHILERLGASLSLLTGGAVDTPSRHHTLRDTIAWSYNLLVPHQQELFRGLSVFCGGFTLEAALEVVWSTAHGRTDEQSLLDGLAWLVDHHLLQQHEEPGGLVRFTMLATIHAFAAERLAAKKEAEAMRRRHAAYFTVFAERAEQGSGGAELSAWLDRLRREYDNLRAALDWAREQADSTLNVRLSGSVWWFWRFGGHFNEGRRWLDTALRTRDAAPIAVQAKALYAASVLASLQGDYAQSVRWCEESLALWRTLGDQRGVAQVLHSVAVNAMGLFDYDRAQRCFEEILALHEANNDEDGIAYIAVYLPAPHLYRGDARRARMMLERAMALNQTQQRIYNLVICYPGIVQAALAEHDFAAACQYNLAGLALYQRLAIDEGICYALESGGSIAAMQAQPLSALRLFGAAEALREQIGATLPPHVRAFNAPFVRAAQTAMTTEQGGAIWAEGRVSSRSHYLDELRAVCMLSKGQQLRLFADDS
jgi:predicted ATPase/DNA-binding SARP family transcriptional activator